MVNTPYDDVFRTLLTDCTELIIPVINEIFHTNYTGKEKICLLQNEHFIQMPGGRVSYAVPVLKVKAYTVNELFEKRLFFLIPFHIFTYEKDFKELEKNTKKLERLETEYALIKERLEMVCKMGALTEYPKAAILDMSCKVAEHLAAKYENVAKGVCQQMGGKVLEYEAKDILRKGEERAKIQIATKLLRLGNDIKYVADLAELSEEVVSELAQNIDNDREN